MKNRIWKSMVIIVLLGILLAGCETKETELAFEDLAKKYYSYSTGLDAWGEEFYIEKDGLFHGSYYSTLTWEAGDGYPDGTRYYSCYEGKITNLQRVSKFMYEINLSDFHYTGTEESESLDGGFRYIYDNFSNFDKTDKFTIYLPGMPVKEIPEEVYNCISDKNESETELTVMVLADIPGGIGICTYDRME